MQQSLPHRGTKKRLAKVRLQKIVSLQPPSDHGLQWEQFVLSWQPSLHYPLQQQPMSSPSPESPPPTYKLHWYEHLVIFLFRALVVFSLIAMIGNAIHGTFFFSSYSAIATTQEPANTLTTSPPTKPLQWTTTHTFSGNGSQKTATFNVGTHWRMVWSCNPASVNGLDNLVIIEVDAPDGSIIDSGMETMCQQNNTYGVKEIHAGGQVYLNVVSGGDWRVQVQEWE